MNKIHTVKIEGPVLTQATRKNTDDFQHAIETFLQCETSDILSVVKHLEPIYLSIGSHAMKEFMTHLAGMPYLLPAEREGRFSARQINVDGEMSGEGTSLHFVRYHDVPVIVQCDFAHRYEGRSKIECLVHKASEETAKALIKQFESIMKQTPTKFVFDGNGKPLPPSQPLTWDDIVLPEPAKQLILQQTLALTIQGPRSKRGMLIHGKPGNGKTLLGKILAHTLNCHCFYITSQMFDRHEGKALTNLFEMARLLKPSILFFEDIDLLLGSHRENNPNKALLGELLNQLDGPVANTNMLIIATTNDITKLDDALANRPGRFDVKIEFKNPATEARRALLKKILTSHTDQTLSPMVDLTQGLSCAQVNEVGYYVQDNPNLSIQEIESYVKIVQKYGEREFGFRFEAEKDRQRQQAYNYEDD